MSTEPAAAQWRPASGASVFFSSFGLNIFDVAMAATALRIAEAEHLGSLWQPFQDG